MNTIELIPKYREEIDRKLYDIYPKGPSSLTGPIKYVLRAGGKRLRPLLTILSAEACGGSKESAMSAALAVEVLHNFTLIHDDIMDRDNVRHGQPTVHQKWDDGTAILAGDAMLSLALSLLKKSPTSSLDQMEIFIEGLLAVCEGQALDKEFETIENVKLKNYMRMVDLKTGHIIGLSAELGAISSNSDQETCKALRDYGRLVGRAFQIQDDYLEIFSNSSNMGKSLKSDIVLGKKTFLMIAGLEKNKKIIQESLKIAHSNFNKGISKIREYFINEGIQEKTLKEINMILELADNRIYNLSINKERLHYFSELIKKRGN